MEKKSYLGRIQSAILALLWNREMYGLEIQNHLRTYGIRIGSGQLYPTLNRLEKKNLIQSKITHRVGADRKYYTINDKGKQEMVKYALDFLNLFSNIVFEPFYEQLSKLITNQIEIKSGMIVQDFSLEFYEEVIIEIVSKLGSSGRYIILSDNENNLQVLEDRMEYYDIKENIIIIDKHNNKETVPDQSVDLVLVIFTFHEDENEWIISEIARILKTDGQALIIDIEFKEDLLVIKTLINFLPRHTTYGLEKKKFTKLLSKNGLTICEENHQQGILTMRVKRICYD